MKKVAQYRSKLEGHIVHESLLNRGIKSELIGTRDYSSIVTGGLEEGKFDLLVEDEKFDEVKKILFEMEMNKPKTSEDHLKLTPNQLIRKSITMAILAAILLPIVFNIASISIWRQYLKVETNRTKKIIVSVLILGLQLLAVWGVYFSYNLLSDFITSFTLEEY